MHETRSVYKIKALTSIPYNHVVNKVNFQHFYHFFTFWEVLTCYLTIRRKRSSFLGTWQESLFQSSHCLHSFVFYRPQVWGRWWGRFYFSCTQKVAWTLESAVWVQIPAVLVNFVTWVRGWIEFSEPLFPYVYGGSVCGKLQIRMHGNA